MTRGAVERHRAVIMRLRERLRYGLLTQEVLDRLARIGLLFYPYLLVDDSPAGQCKPQISPPPGIAFYELGSDQAMVVAGVPCRPRQVAEVERLMQTSRCFGAFEGGALVGYVWANLSAVWTPIGGDVLFELNGRGAYLFDMYIARTHRGKRLAPWLRLRVLESLLALGRSEVYSLSLSLNRSTRRFKARLGAVEIEQRLAVGVKHVFGADLRLRSLLKTPSPTPQWLRLHGWVGNS